MEVLHAMSQPAGQAGSGGFMAFLPMILMFGIIYFLLIRPQMNRSKAQRAMIDNLQKGDQVITRGGIIGKIEAFKTKNDAQILLDIGKGMKITIARPYIVGPVGSDGDVPEEK